MTALPGVDFRHLVRYGELINVRSLSPMVRLSAASGLMWALIAWFIGYRVFGDRIWGGIVVAPLIGILIGRLSWPMRNKPRWAQIAGRCFTFTLRPPVSRLAWPSSLQLRSPQEVSSLSSMSGRCSGVSRSAGTALILWPLSFFNHRLVWQADAGLDSRLLQKSARRSRPLESLAVRIMVLCVLGTLLGRCFNPCWRPLDRGRQ